MVISPCRKSCTPFFFSSVSTISRINIYLEVMSIKENKAIVKNLILSYK